MSSTNATVTCTSATARFEFNRVENVHISGMTFQGCRNTAISMSQVTSASIMRSTFIGNQAVSGSSRNGGSLYIVSSSITISESEFQNNSAYYSGGAIYASSSTIRIIGSRFSYNTQEYRYSQRIGGGAISASYSNITVNGSLFTYNSARNYYYHDGGGAIYALYSGIFQVLNTVFIGNRAYYNTYRSISGGAIL
jgi:predicted outer membrane repeat protein